jgi:hypothetical protein
MESKNNKPFLLVTGILLALILAACQSNFSSDNEETPREPKTVEVTRIVQQTVEVTRIVLEQEPITIKETEAATDSAYPTANQPSIKILLGSSAVQMDPDYFDGLIVLTQYYTLLDHGLYEESYPMLSSAQQKRYSFEDYKSFYIHDLKALEVREILPYNYWRVQQELPTLQFPPNELRYVILMTAFHYGAAWNEGGTPMPDNMTGFQSLILENNEWKIDDFNTSPWAQ